MQANKALLLSAMLSSSESIENAEIATFDASCVSTPDISVDLEPIQDLHGYANPWPAGGSVNKLSCGTAFTETSNGITLTSDGTGIYSLKGTATDAFSYSFDIPEIVLPSTVYIHLMNSAGGSTNGAINIDFYNGSTRVDFLGFGTAPNRKYNGTSALGDKTINKLVIRVTIGESISGTLTFSPMALVVNDTVDFVPYSNTCPISGRSEVNVYVEETYDPQATPKATIQLGQTVYGGTVDVTEGKMTVDRAMVDLGTLTWTTYSSPDRHVFRSVYPSPLPFIGSNILPPHAICSSYYPMAYNPISANDNGAFSLGNDRVVVIDHRFSDADSFGGAVNGVQLVYELSTPVEVTLTPQEIKTLIGENNVWSDSGNISVLNITCNADFLRLFLMTKLIGDC